MANQRDLTRELHIRCLGCIKYKDRSPMGIYGYSILEGSTDFRQLVNDSEIPYYDMNEVRCSVAEDWAVGVSAAKRTRTSSRRRSKR